MPVFSTLGVAVKEYFGATVDIESITTVIWATDEAQALGQTLLSVQKQFPDKDGWKYKVKVAQIDLKWLQGIIDYEKNLTAGKG